LNIDKYWAKRWYEIYRYEYETNISHLVATTLTYDGVAYHVTAAQQLYPGQEITVYRNTREKIPL